MPDTAPGEGVAAARGLFGEAPDTETGASATSVPETAPETQLNLTLRGVLTLGEGNGFAFIVTGRGEESVYTPGETLPGDATLERVYRDRVLLSRRGSLETLRLDRENASAMASSTTGHQQGGTAVEDFDRQRASETATALRARLREQPAELMRMVRFEPYQQNGELQGFRLRPRGDVNERVLRGLGLTPNDVVTSINGIPLSNRSRLGEVLNVLGRTDEARVRFLRDGEARRINIPMGDGG
ncbi:MAG: type II secretion system protein N [Halofilum sp. (in: g-proteobacteria)]|nr:type II secretion system protein N [Halofilum sp. (in: g-proteobacteria)]